MSRQEVRYAKDGCSFELGTLNYSEMVDAFNQLEAEGFKDIDEELNVRILLFHAYNDMFRNDNNPTEEVNESDKNLFQKNTLWLIENWTKDDVLQAELYREIGEMKKAKTLLENVNTDKDFLIIIKNEMIKRININDTKVFEITSLI